MASELLANYDYTYEFLWKGLFIENDIFFARTNKLSTYIIYIQQ
jgi:hypothetical protein